MELKRMLVAVFFSAPLLLIVPYGIETIFLSNSYRFVILLIVPYGIETGSARSGIRLLAHF